jgi:hypothetical protein
VRCSVEAMRRIAFTIAALLALAAPAPAVAGDAPRLRAIVSACQTGFDPVSRLAAFTASMPAADDTARMAIRFDLQQRTADGGVWQRVAAPSFGRWERSRPGVAGFVYTKDVHGLTAPGEYRAIVRFRWWSADGKIRNARKVTRSCRQPDPRPNVLAGRLTAAPTSAAGVASYRVVLRNGGRSAAGPFAVVLLQDGAEVARTTVAGLAPGGLTTVELLAPACPAGTVLELHVDADDAVDEAGEEDSVVRPACPLAGEEQR